MSSQPESLRLADWLDCRPVLGPTFGEISGELRRQHALIAELVEALQYAVVVMHNADNTTGHCCCGAKITENSMRDGHSPVDEGLYHQHNAIDAARAALAKAGLDR